MAALAVYIGTSRPTLVFKCPPHPGANLSGMINHGTSYLNILYSWIVKFGFLATSSNKLRECWTVHDCPCLPTPTQPALDSHHWNPSRVVTKQLWMWAKAAAVWRWAAMEVLGEKKKINAARGKCPSYSQVWFLVWKMLWTAEPEHGRAK